MKLQATCTMTVGTSAACPLVAMQRRQMLQLATRLTLAVAACALQPVQAQPSYTVTAEQMREALARRFPRRYKAGGFLALDMQAPALRLLPKENRLGADIQLEASGPALPDRHSGVFDLDFALRYEASDQSIRAHQLKVNTLRFSGMPPRQAELLSAYGPTLAEQALRDVVLHQLRPQDLMLADGLGMEPGAITVTARGLSVGFVTKPLR